MSKRLYDITRAQKRHLSTEARRRKKEHRNQGKKKNENVVETIDSLLLKKEKAKIIPLLVTPPVIAEILPLYHGGPLIKAERW